ncbi:MAG TPA: hypothetical protein VMU02_07515, partial [bacterium]|nr:hypothetical protein [bacterium]
MMRTWAIVTSLLVVLATAGLAGDAGTRSPFSLGAGARDLALGGAVASGADPATSVYWNPSLLARVDRISVTGFHTGLYGSSTGYQYVGVAVPTLDLGGFGAGLFRLGVDDIERRDANNLYLGDFGESRLAFYLGYGRSLGAYDLGLAVSLEHQTFDATSATSSPGLDLAVAREIRTDLAWLPEASLGLDARNILRPAITLQSDAVRYPSALDAGVALNVIPVRKWNQMLTLRAQLTTVSHLDPELAMGLEYSLDDRLHLRAGVRGGQTSFGAGVCYQSISIDYALVERDLGSIQTVSISASLGMPKSQKRRAREEEREAQFNRLLETRLAAQNREAVTRLVAESESLVTAGSLGEASTMIERACLLAGGSGAEADSGVYAQAQELRTRLDSQLAERAYAAYMDSAQAKLAARDYLSAKYFAELALTKHGGSAQADSLLGEADAAIAQGASE